MCCPWQPYIRSIIELHVAYLEGYRCLDCTKWSLVRIIASPDWLPIVTSPFFLMRYELAAYITLLRILFIHLYDVLIGKEVKEIGFVAVCIQFYKHGSKSSDHILDSAGNKSSFINSCNRRKNLFILFLVYSPFGSFALCGSSTTQSENILMAIK